MKLDFSIPAPVVEIWPCCFSLYRFISVNLAGLISNLQSKCRREVSFTHAGSDCLVCVKRVCFSDSRASLKADVGL